MTSLKSLVGLPSSIGISMKFVDYEGFQMVVYPNTMRKLKKYIRHGQFDKYNQALLAMNPERHVLKIKTYDNRVTHTDPPVFVAADYSEDPDVYIIGKKTTIAERQAVMMLPEEVQDNSFFYEKSV